MMFTAIYKIMVFILKFGIVLKKKLGMKRKNDIAQRIRQLGRLKLELGIGDMNDMINPMHFDSVLNANRSLCRVSYSEENIQVFQLPGLA